jgi:hypothetical protein
MQSVSTFSGQTLRELGGGGLALATICSQSPGKIHHISTFLKVRHLVRPPVATYGSCFLTSLVISFKNHIKDELKKMPEIFLYFIICCVI